MRFFMACVFVLVLCAPALAAEHRTLLGDVRLTAPDTWFLQSHEPGRAGETILFLIPNPATEGTRDSANALLSVVVNDGPMDVAEYGDRLAATYAHQPGMRMAGDVACNGWRTLAWTSRAGRTRYAVVEHMGVDKDFRVSFRAAFPLLQDNEAWREEMIAGVRLVHETLRLGGAGKACARLVSRGEAVGLEPLE